MKKLLFTFFAIVLFGTTYLWGADPVGYYHYSKPHGTIASENSWTSGGTYTSFKIGNVEFKTVNGSGQSNGKYRNAKEWVLYREYNNGPLTVSADDGYWISALAIEYTPYFDGVLSDKTNKDDEPQTGYASGATISANKKVMNLYVGRSTVRTSGNYGFIGCTNFAVTYYKLPTEIALNQSTMSLTTIGQTSTLTVTATPSDAYAGCSWESSNTAVATVDKTGKVTAVAVGTATITAKSVDGTKTATCEVTVWGNPTASFAKTVESKNIGDPAFTNALTTQSTGAVTYSSSDESVATVDANGEVTIVNGGSTKITASIAKEAPYNAKEIFYTLDVSHTPEANKYWTEDFSNITAGSSSESTIDVDGKSGVYKWSITNYQRSTKTDATGDLVNGEQGMRLRYPSVWTMVNPEGGIKEVAFDWRASGKDNVVHFWVGPEGNEYEYSRVAVGSNTTVMHFARQFDVADNVALKFRMSGAKENPQQTYAIIGPVKIVPYLLYTVKSDTAKVSSKSWYKPNYLIKNTPNNAVISYSSSNPEVDVDDDGAVDVSKAFADPITITATWGDVSTSFSLLIQNKEICQASFASSKVSVARGETPANNLTIQTFSGETAPEVVYVSSNPEVATIGANNSITTLAPGKTTITAQIGETDMHLAGSASYELTVTYTPTAGTYWTETFNDAGDINTYTTKTIDGDDGTEDKWTLNDVMRHSTDVVGTERGIRLQYSSTIASNVTLEGGIQEVIFNWRPLNPSHVPHFYVQVGNDSPHSITIPQKTTDVQAYAHIFNKKSNTSLTIGNYAKETPTEQGFVVVGEVKVIPYLLFKGNKQVDIDLDNVKSFNLNDTLLNSTEGGTINFAVDSFKTDVAPTITDGVVDLSNLTQGGKVYISATWNENPDVKTTLVLQTATTPDVSFADAGPIDKTIGDASFTNALTPMEGLGEITYSSLNTSVATVDAASGLVTLVSSGTATIQATVAASDIYKETSTTYQLNVAGYTPETGKSWVETFSRLSKTSGYVSDEQSFMGDSLVYGWKINNYNRPNKDNPFRMQTNGYIKMNGNQEGGIKYAQLNWEPLANGSTNFIMAAGEQSCPFEGVVTKDQPYVFEHFFNIKENTSLSVTMGSTGVKANMQVVNITIVPYLLYTTKSHSMNMNEGATYKNESLIDNRDDEVAITYESSDDAVATVEDGTVTAKKAGTVTIKAKWGDVSTSYKLTISAKTAISFVRNDGTEDVDVVDNNVGETFPSFTLPTRTGYRFNAYWTAADTAQGYRFTITALNGNTGWVAGRQIGQDKFTDGSRKWIYGGAEYTLYAEWRPELTIVLDNQSATTAGTEQVITAKCENNNSVNLQNSNIEVPEKDNCTFMGYYTEAEGQGLQLIDATGAFKASVTGYTNEYKMWQKSEGATLYAYWKEGIILNDTEDNAQKIADNAGKTMDVTTNRRITANMYNTICLPFDVDEDQMEAVFGSYKLVEFTSATLAGDVLTIYFNDASTIEAGKPYLIKTATDTTNIAFHDVEIVNTTGSSVGEGDFTMVGLVNPKCVEATEKSHLIVVANDNLSWITAGDTEKVKGMRAYFQVKGSMQAAIRRVNPRLAISDVNTPTDLVNANANVNVNCKVMIDDKLYILRNGRYYDVLGK